jgi:hypothetical protein
MQVIIPRLLRLYCNCPVLIVLPNSSLCITAHKSLALRPWPMLVIHTPRLLSTDYMVFKEAPADPCNRWCRAEFASSDEDRSGFGVGINMTRALASEFVACDLTSSLSAIEALQYLCHELPVVEDETEATETTFLLGGRTGGTGGSGDPESGRKKKQYEGIAFDKNLCFDRPLILGLSQG